MLLNCHKFLELPTEIQVAQWFGDHLSNEAGPLLGKVAGRDIDEREKRIMVSYPARTTWSHSWVGWEINK